VATRSRRPPRSAQTDWPTALPLRSQHAMSTGESARAKLPPGPQLPDARRRAPQLCGDRLPLARILTDGEPGELVHSDLERRGERAAEEREAEAHRALIGAELQGDELARVGGRGQ